MNFTPSISDTSNDAAAHEAIRGQIVVKRVERMESPVFQISGHIRQMIQEARLRPGMKLPTNRTLSVEMGVDPSAVQRALAGLVKEGLLIRRRRVGTFVAEPPKRKLERVAFYYPAGEGESLGEFGRTLLTEITRLGHSGGFAVEVFSDTRKRAETELCAPDDLIRQTRTRRVQGVVAPSVTLAHLKWLERLAVPISSLSNPRFPHAINWNREDLAASAVRQLAARGCRRIGLITTLLAHKDPDADSYQLGLWRGFTGALERAGLEIHPGRMAGSKDLNHIPSQSEMPACGFAGFNRLWNGVAAGERPDGLFIYPDTAAIGAVMALGMHNIQVPRDLRLVLHTNAEFPVFCPYPADRLVVRVADAAHALIGHIRDQLANRAPASRLLPNHLEPDDGSPLHS